jgi:hypothetical protein
MKLMQFVPAGALLVSGIAAAQPVQPEVSGVATEVPAVDHAFEVGVATGFAMGFGKVGNNMDTLEQISEGGGSVELDLGYRFTPNLSAGVYGTFSVFNSEHHTKTAFDVVSTTAGLQATWHVRPAQHIDPWINVGAGWKAMWFDLSGDSAATALQGIELARLQVGIDTRLSRTVAIAPVLGGSASMFLGQGTAMTSMSEIRDKEVNFTGFAGVAGRFDLAGAR